MGDSRSVTLEGGYESLSSFGHVLGRRPDNDDVRETPLGTGRQDGEQAPFGVLAEERVVAEGVA